MTARRAYAVTALAEARPPSDAARTTIDRAVGLLAGRANCRLADAHRHLVRMAADAGRDVATTAAEVIRSLDVAAGQAVVLPPLPPVRAVEPWLAAVQRVLDVIPGMAALLTPVRDPAGRLVDLVYAAVSANAVAGDGRRGRQLLGLSAAGDFAQPPTAERWRAYADVLDTGRPARLGPFRYGDAHWTVRATRLDGALMLGWERYDDPLAGTERVGRTEQLGNLGWGEWDLVTGEVTWSEQLYRIYERDPALGPLSRDESEALEVADDRPLRIAAMQEFDRGERVDVTTRVRIGGRIKHLRTVADAVRDGDGRPLRVYGIVQDVTAQERGAQRLAEVERSLAAEHALAGRLQQIILPLPGGPIELPGLKVALRYLPATQESLVGGDWYHAATQRDGSVLLAVGDVAGHGLTAATTMAQLRHALRALSVVTTCPAELLGHLNRLTCDLDAETPETVATAVVARWDPDTRRITWAQAGHPPPLLSRAGRTAPLDRPAGAMLGVVENARYQTRTLDLALGDVLLFYTDGLVEHRGRGPDHGLDAVIATVDEAVAASPRQPLAELLNRLRRANPDDDTCILAARPVSGGTRDLRSYLAL